jgi:enterochelin esterase-like enzyme
VSISSASSLRQVSLSIYFRLLRASTSSSTQLILVALSAPWLVFAQRQPLEFDVRWVNPPAKAEKRTQHRILHSPSMKRDVGWNLYLPPDYETSTRRYPVIYWLHGAGGDESSGLWIAAELDKAIAAGLTAPAMMIFPNGGKRTEYRDWPDQNVLAETMIIRELIPFVDANFRTVANKLGRAVEGMSMGGNGALKLALKYPELFGSVVAYAGSYRRLPLDGYFPGIAAQQQAWIAKLAQWYSAEDDVFELANRNVARLGELRIRFVGGTKDVSVPDAEALHNWLVRCSIPHEYEILLGVAHDTKAYYERAGLHGFQFHASAFARADRGR